MDLMEEGIEVGTRITIEIINVPVKINGNTFPDIKSTIETLS